MYIFGHIPFGISVLLLILVLGFFIYMAVVKLKKYNQTKNPRFQSIGGLMIVLSILVGLLLLGIVFRHYRIRTGI